MIMANLKRVDEGGGKPQVMEVPQAPAYLDASDPEKKKIIKSRAGAGTAAVLSWIEDYGGRCVLYVQPDEDRVRVNGKRPTACCLEHGDRLRVGPAPFVFLERLPLEVLVAQEAQQQRCVYCHGEVLEQERYLRCPSCGAVHHLDHWFDFNGGMCGDCRYAATLEDEEKERHGCEG